MGSSLRHALVRAGALFLSSTVAIAAPQVVGDEACEKYAVDIESFATCIDGKVVRPTDAIDGRVPMAPAPARAASLQSVYVDIATLADAWLKGRLPPPQTRFVYVAFDPDSHSRACLPGRGGDSGTDGGRAPRAESVLVCAEGTCCRRATDGEAGGAAR